MAKSRARYLAELLGLDGRVKTTTSALSGADGIIDLEVLPTLPNSKLENSSVSIAGHPLSLGGSLTLDTADISEHVSYKYYTDARSRAAISVSGDLSYNSTTGVVSFTERTDAEVRGLVSVSGSLSYNSTTGVISYTTPTTIASLSNHTTTDLSEGTNLYYTTARFDTAFSGKSTTDLSEGTNLYYTTTRANTDFDTRLATKSTTNLSEGTNLYYTDARARAAISVSGSLSYNSTTGVISYTTPTTIASLSNHETDDLSEGTTNLYYTSARANADFDTRLATKSTTNLAEGTNLYYTDARVGSYLTSNSYATQTYVSTAISNLVDSAPATLDTLNELAAALGDDPNFATTVSTSIGTKFASAGGAITGDTTITGSGSSGYALVVNRGSDSAAALKVLNTGEVLVSSNYFYVDAGAGMYVSNAARFRGGISNDTGDLALSDNVTISGTLAVTGTLTADGYNKSLWDTAYGWGNHASAGYQPASTALTTSTTFGGDVSGTYNAIVVANDSHSHTKLSGFAQQTEYDLIRAGNSNGLYFKARWDGATANRYWDMGYVDGFGTFYTGLKVYNNGSLVYKDNTVWHAGNDGSGSSLDADLLDGQHGSYYAPASHSHGRIYAETGTTSNYLALSSTNELELFNSSGIVQDLYLNHSGGATSLRGPSSSYVWTSGNDGSGSGLDADLLDGVHASSFMRNDATNHEIRFDNEEYDFSWTAHSQINAMSLKVWNNYAQTGAPTTYGTLLDIYGQSGHAHEQIYFDANSYNMRTRYGWYGSDTWSGWATMWNSGNDGSGSGLDADLLDGQHASAFASASHTHSYLPLTGGTVTGTITAPSFDTTNTGWIGIGDDIKLLDCGVANTARFTGKQNSDRGYIAFGNDNTQLGRITTGALTWGGNTIWHAGNDGSGSGLDADTVDGYHANSLRRADYSYDFTVDGDANTYYPVTITSAGHYAFQRYSISRGYSWTAPTTWNTSTHKGGLTFTWEMSGDGAWGGNNKDLRVIQFAETYSNMVAGLGLSTGGGGAGVVVIWLRGGGAQYRVHGPAGVEGSATVHLSGFTASNGSVFSARTNLNSVGSEIYNRMPVRSTSQLYDSGSRVWYPGNDGSGSGLDADLLDGIDSGSFARSDANDTLSGQYTFTKTDDHAIKVGTIRGTAVGSQSGEYIHMYNRVHIGGPSGWGASNAAAPSYGLSTYGGADLATATGSVTIGGNTAWHAGNDGSGSGLDADLLDGSHKTDIQRELINVTSPAVTAADSCLPSTGYGLKHFLGYGPSNNDGHIIGMSWTYTSSYGAQIYVDTDPNNIMAFRSRSSTGVWTSWNTLWHGANDGSGSGLDADLLDGQHGSYYLPTDTARSNISASAWAGGNGYHGYTYSGGNWRFGFSSTSGVVDVYADGNFYATDSSHLVLHAGNYNSYSPSLGGNGASGTWGIHVSGNSQGLTIVGLGNNNQTYGQTSGTLNGYTGWASHIIGNHGDGATYYMQDIILPFWGSPKYSRRQGNTTIVGPYDFWTSENDGSGSGLDADLLDGVHASSFARTDSTSRQNFTGSIQVSANNATGGGIVLADDGDIVDLNDAYCSMRFSYGVRIYSANSGGSVRHTLHSDGTFTATGNVTAYSDIRLKENIENIPNALEKVQQIRGVTYTRNDQEDTEKRHTGVIAQEVEKVLPEAVAEDDFGIKNVAYGNMVGLLIEAIKELKAEVEDLKSQLKEK